jgi:hypothetical protein
MAKLIIRQDMFRERHRKYLSNVKQQYYLFSLCIKVIPYYGIGHRIQMK